ncbi:hypothetical protein DEO72_LG3g3510 [Vigna unguiculata]|uniref:Uncharacterized protein n=1 Tax=Vigna unguiculata TaxID=3917 RepID=A0A4D6LKC8_VIGUN|nr:hypothetical protein DEO72_LG3g3510 [Vigna unguiculata]
MVGLMWHSFPAKCEHPLRFQFDSFIVPNHASLSTSPENEPPKTVLHGGEAAENALLHIRTLHSHAPLLARPRYLRLDASL